MSGRIYSGYATTVGNRRMYVRVPAALKRRQTNGSATVLVHGLTRSSRSLRPLIRSLGDRDVYAPDLPGFGMSGEPHVLGLEGLSDELRHWMLGSGLQSVALVACASGCPVAIDLAARYPTLVDRLALVGPTLAPDGNHAVKLTWRWLRATARSSPTRAPGLFRDLLDAGPGRAARSVRSALSAPVAEWLGLIEAPTLVVRGAHDPFVPPGLAGELVDAIPNARLVSIPHAGHGAFAATRKLSPVLREFLEADADSLTPKRTSRRRSAAPQPRRVESDPAERREAADGASFTAIPVKLSA